MNYQDVLSPEEIQQYTQEGYTPEDMQRAINEQYKDESLEQSYQQAQQLKNNNPLSQSSNSLVTGINNENLIQWQLELDSILERIEHLLRGDKPAWKNGSIIWQHPKTQEEMIFNEVGITEIMRILSMYVNRNAILSNYREETINGKMFNLGNELADLIFLKYETIGLDTQEKRKLYSMIVREMIDIIHSSYLRALHGKENENLRTARTVTQMDNLSMGMMFPQMNQPRKERSVLNPMRIFKGKYVN